MQSIRIEKTTMPKSKPDAAVLGFGKYFTDHMFMMEYTPDKGLARCKNRAVWAPFLSAPRRRYFVTGAEIFEGLKAYRTPKGERSSCSAPPRISKG